MTNKPKKKKRSCLAIIKFYCTAFFILLACFSSFVFVFLVPFVIDPAFATLFAEFDPEPLTCVTVSAFERFGLKNCLAWSSCREGCTGEVYNCTQIYVNYFRDTEGILNGTNFVILKETDHITWQFKEAKLFPNIKGCGYPPTVNCTIFHAAYQNPGSVFSCFYSRQKPNITITQLNIEETKENLMYAIVIPWSCFITSVVYLICAYVCGRKQEESISSPSQEQISKSSKDVSSYSLRSIGKSLNQGVPKIRKHTDDKGSFILLNCENDSENENFQ